MTQDDKRLLARLRDRDDAARRELHDRHRERLRRYFRSRFTEADDLVNEVFTRAWERLEAGAQPTESVDRWLWGIARNVGYERERARVRTIGADPSFFEDLADDADVWAEGWDGKAQAIQDAWEIIARLTGPRRTVLTAHLKAIGRDGHELRGAELAQELGPPWSREKVDRDLSRAKADVRQQMGALAVARAAGGCVTAARLVGRTPDPRLPLADLSGKALAALARHADPVGGSPAEAVCPHCGIVYRDAQRSGLYVLGPGAALLAVRLAPDDEEKRRAVVMLLGRDRPDAGLLQRGRDVVAVGFARVAQVPGVSAAIQAVQHNPLAMRAAAVAGSVAVALLLASAAPPVAPIVSLTSPPPAIAAPSPDVPTPVAMPSPEPSPSPTALPSGDPSGAPTETPAAGSTGEPSLPSAPLTERATTIDATALSHDRLTLVGVGWWQARESRTLDLEPGRYAITSFGATPIPFTVDEAGVVDYDPALAHLSGRGTRTLTVSGLPLTVDASAMAYPQMAFSQATAAFPNRRRTLRMLPGGYTLYGAYSTGVRITLSPSGTIDFDRTLSYVEGRGTDVLIVTGLPVTLDGTALSYSHVSLSQATPWLLNTSSHPVRLMPGRYTFYGSYSTGLVFTLSPSGTIDFDASVSYAVGRGTNALTVSGLPLTLDGTALAHTHISLGGLSRWLPNASPQALRMMPGRYSFTANGATIGIRFTMDGSGHIDYGSEIPYVAGRGSSTLTVTGLPVTVDATGMGAQRFTLTPATGSYDTAVTQPLRLLPGNYRFHVATVRNFPLTLTTGGTFSYAPGEPHVSGLGTATLTVG